MHPIVFSSGIIVPDTTLIQESSGEAVILSLATESYYGLDDTGTRMWNALTASPSIQSAYESLLGIYEVEETTLRSDFMAFIADLVENQLIRISEHA
jgi:Coenzyme PQQ synthesis protein D (PqqD)